MSYLCLKYSWYIYKFSFAIFKIYNIKNPNVDVLSETRSFRKVLLYVFVPYVLEMNQVRT